MGEGRFELSSLVLYPRWKGEVQCVEPLHAILQLPSPVEKSSIYIHGSLVHGGEGNMQEESGNAGVEGADTGVAYCSCFLLACGVLFFLLVFFLSSFQRIYLLRHALIV